MIINEIQPMQSQVLITLNRREENEKQGEIITKVKGTILDIQNVVAVGPMTTQVKPGDVVAVNWANYCEVKHLEGSLKDNVIEDNPVVEMHPNMVVLHGNITYALIYEREIRFIIKSYSL